MSFISTILVRLGGFARHRRGAVAVEFALVLPFALAFYVGVSEVSDGVMTSRKVTTATRTLVDLVSQQGTSNQANSTPTPINAMTSTQLASIFAAAQLMLSPQPTNTLTMTVSAIDVRNSSSGTCCTATVRWSYTQGGTLRPCGVKLQPGPSTGGSTSTLPSGFMPSGTPLPTPLAFIAVDVSYTYQPVITSTKLPFAPVMNRTEYMMPRTAGQVVTGTLPPSGTQNGTVCY